MSNLLIVVTSFLMAFFVKYFDIRVYVCTVHAYTREKWISKTNWNENTWKNRTTINLIIYLRENKQNGMTKQMTKERKKTWILWTHFIEPYQRKRVQHNEI